MTFLYIENFPVVTTILYCVLLVASIPLSLLHFTLSDEQVLALLQVSYIRSRQFFHQL